MAYLREIAHARSGDKGDVANIGLIAKESRYYPLIEKQVTEQRVAEHFEGICHGEVTRYKMPNIDGFNFVLEQALGGGGMRSLYVDHQGKTYSGALLRMEIVVDSERFR